MNSRKPPPTLQSVLQGQSPPAALKAEAASTTTIPIQGADYLKVNVPIGQVIGVDFVQKVDVFDKKVEHRDDNLLAAAIGHLRSLCGPLQGCAVVTEVAGWVHVMLWGNEREVLSAPSVPMPFHSLHRMSVSWWQSPSPHRMVTRAQSPSQVSAGG